MIVIKGKEEGVTLFVYRSKKGAVEQICGKCYDTGVVSLYYDGKAFHHIRHCKSDDEVIL